MKLSLLSPVNPLWLTQVFGGNKNTYKQFGLEGHNGLDMLAIHGQPVYATHDGEATYSIDGSNGHLVVITSDREYDFPGYGQVYLKTVYGHLADSAKEPRFASPVFKAKNQTLKVKKGDLIGYADNTGFSTGDHLHFGLKPMMKNSKGKLYNLLPDNGYKGAIDPFPFIEKPLPVGTSVPYEEAVALLRKAGLPKLVLLAAELILRRKYGK